MIRFRRMLLGFAAALAMLGTAALAPPAAAQTPAEFYKGKTVRFIVNVGVGGGFDAYARMIAPHLGKVLDATVVVENLPGAGGILALNQMMIAQPDGLRMIIYNGGPLLLAQILEQENIKYDLTKLPHLGVISAEPWGVMVSPSSPIRTPADLVRKGQKIRFGGTGPTGGPSDGASITCEALQLDCRVVLGYRGSAEIALAVQRGELDAIYITDTSLSTYEKGQQGHVVGIAARKRSTLLPSVPTIYEALQLTSEQQWWLDFRAELNEYGRMLATMPGIPADRLAFLRGAVAKVLNDPEVIAEGAKTQRFIDYRDGETMEKLARKLVDQVTADRKAQVREVVLKKFIN
jgi:tripartite-type tricarboxylate transporter receptor subunit TctC